MHKIKKLSTVKKRMQRKCDFLSSYTEGPNSRGSYSKASLRGSFLGTCVYVPMFWKVLCCVPPVSPPYPLLTFPFSLRAPLGCILRLPYLGLCVGRWMKRREVRPWPGFLRSHCGSLRLLSFSVYGICAFPSPV